MRILITAGPTREPIDEVRYISNRSSGRMGAALISAALKQNHQITAIVGPLSIPLPQGIQRIDIETAAEMQQAVMQQFPNHELLIMAAAVADYRPVTTNPGKLPSCESLSIQFESTPDIIALASQSKRADQRTIAFSLESAVRPNSPMPGGIERARQKMLRKNVDLMVFNPTETMESPTVQSVLLYPDGRSEQLHSREKADFADILLRRATDLFTAR
jgi:phosphopantothenoylcysteine decarboxylase/phosphopantothenate--cysteine ligase